MAMPTRPQTLKELFEKFVMRVNGAPAELIVGDGHDTLVWLSDKEDDEEPNKAFVPHHCKLVYDGFNVSIVDPGGNSLDMQALYVMNWESVH